MKPKLSITGLLSGLILASMPVQEAHAQAQAATSTASNAVTQFVGSGVSTSNISFTGDSRQLGVFAKQGTATSAPNIGLEEGIILSTGRVTDCTPANNEYSESFDFDGAGDADLNLLGNAFTQDAAVLEFDFVPSENFVNFEFQFATEEQLSDCNAGYADLMGFFLSGPGISGPYSNNAINLAVIPGTTTPVGICTINSSTNSQYYTGNSYGTWSGNDANVEYESIMDIFTASYNNLQCGKKYHLKIAIGDDSDGLLDAVVFLKRNSLRSPSAITGLIFPSPVCENELINLGVEIVGSTSGYLFNWETGETSQYIKWRPTLDKPRTYVVVTTPTGCQKTLYANIDIHSTGNVPSYTKGFDDTYDFQYVINAGQPLISAIRGYDDDTSDDIHLSWNGAISAASFNISNNGTANPIGYFVWLPGLGDMGVHNFTVTTLDEDACGSSTTVANYSVRVVCPNCPVDIYQQNRNSGTSPLLPLTESGGSIYAGEDVTNQVPNGLVNLTGTPSLTRFEAGYKVRLEPGFQATATSRQWFNGRINPELCMNFEECQDCCRDWNGFTIDLPLPNVLSPNGDGLNDLWMALDADNPYCAYSAMGFDLRVFNRWGNEVFRELNISPFCCNYVSPFMPNASNPASINWDGRNNNNVLLTNGTYFIVLKLFGCNGETITLNQEITMTNSAGSASGKLKPENSPELEDAPEALSIMTIPNPSQTYTDLNFNIKPESTPQIKIMDIQGRNMVCNIDQKHESAWRIETSHLAPGIYLVHVMLDGEVLTTRFVKE